jgi:putative ABC transport system ATP-binding protein
MIRLAGVSKVFNVGRRNAFAAIRDVDLEIPGQAITVLRGPSGSGKTTLLTLIGCMARPTTGRIWLGDREIGSLPERFAAETRRKTFGFVFQNDQLIRGITALENVMLPAYPDGGRYRNVRDRARELLERFQVGGRAGERVEHLSGGERQRVAIARALVNAPEVVVADEPTAHLDSALAQTFLAIASELKREGKTVIIASHDPLVVETAGAERIVSMRDGRLVPAEHSP